MRLSEIVHPHEINFVFNHLQHDGANLVTKFYVRLYTITDGFKKEAVDVFDITEIATYREELQQWYSAFKKTVPENSQLFELIGYMTQYFVS